MITTVSPSRSDAGLTQAHQLLDELIAGQAYDSPSQDVSDDFEVLTALIYYYEQRTRKPGEFAQIKKSTLMTKGKKWAEVGSAIVWRSADHSFFGAKNSADILRQQ